MDDEKIIELFFLREEAAIASLQSKYGAYCTRIAMNLLSDSQDAEECVNDALLQAWNRIPPECPRSLKAWLGKVVHDKAIDLWKKNHTQKRYPGLTQTFHELEESVPSPRNMERDMENAELIAAIERWLDVLKPWERRLFLRRYWYGISLSDLAQELEIAPGKLAQIMYRLRRNLKIFLKKEEKLHV